MDLCTLLKHTVALQHRSFLGLVQTVQEVSASTASSDLLGRQNYEPRCYTRTEAVADRARAGSFM